MNNCTGGIPDINYDQVRENTERMKQAIETIKKEAPEQKDRIEFLQEHFGIRSISECGPGFSFNDKGKQQKGEHGYKYKIEYGWSYSVFVFNKELIIKMQNR